MNHPKLINEKNYYTYKLKENKTINNTQVHRKCINIQLVIKILNTLVRKKEILNCNLVILETNIQNKNKMLIYFISNDEK